MGLASNFVANLPRLPPKQERKVSNNPITLMRTLTPLQWAFFASGWLSWLCDAIDFFAVSLTVTRLSKAFEKDPHSITTSITLTLLFRPVGAVIFGLLSDRYGRKYPLVANLLICGILSLGTGFVRSFPEFLAVRSLFGIAMGGIWGQAATLCLENLHVSARGLFSGIMQQGYAVGYLIAAVINLYVVPRYNSWRVLFYVAAGISAGAAALRLALPESTYFVERRAAELASGNQMSSGTKSKIFMKEAGKAMKLNWARSIFAVLLMTGFNFFSHGSQDLYPTYLQLGKKLTAHQSTVATIIGNCGAIAGGTIAGAVSQKLGRRITIIACCLWTIVWLPLWLLPSKFGPLAAGAFFVQSGVQGAWGVVPLYLMEISPPAFRAVWPGIAYQLGNMISAASSQIEATAGEKLKTSAGRPDYGKVSAILIGVVAAWIIGCCMVGTEAHGSHFEKGKAAFEEGAGKVQVIDDDTSGTDSPAAHGSVYDDKTSSSEKAAQNAVHNERV